MSPENLAFYWSTQFVRRLYELGLEHVVISPGSRSTPLTLAFAAHAGIKKHIHVDERSAAFTALGIAKSSRKPAALVCTSGTAVSNYMPAVIEAAQSNVPMLVLSADRPNMLIGVGASQTIDQTRLFGNYTRYFFNTGLPSEDERQLSRLRKAAEQAFFKSLESEGVAHVNFPFKKPLEPTKRYFNTIQKENNEHIDMFINEPPHEEAHHLDLNDHTWSNIIAAERPVIIVGPRVTGADNRSILRLAETLKAPILAEAGSQVPLNEHLIQHYDGFLRSLSVRDDLKPDLILRFGKQPISKSVFTYLRNHLDVQQICFTDFGDLADETLTASQFIHFNGEIQIPEVSGSAPKKWLKSWKGKEQAFVKERDRILKAANSLTDGFIFDEASSIIPDSAFVMLSNSFPVRDFELIADYHPRSYVNRGAAGIDGIISTSIGLSIAENTPGVAFIGDIAFIHDANGLRLADRVKKPLIFILLNNGGGTIFRMLPINNISEVYESYFETPQHVSFTHLCKAHGVSHNLVTAKEQFRPIFEKALTRDKVQVIECITNPNSSMKERTRLWDPELLSSQE
jgi:2-succinyl-5-enolpyruvyl-6-hydroxy-3-cyclohexene-1-carboxylate synthase